jgi:hypothetical protein
MLLFENSHLTPAFQDQTGAHVEGDFVSLRNYNKCMILIHEMRGADATATVFRVDKANTAAGGDEHTSITLNNFWSVADVASATGDVGATAAATVGATDTWTKGTAAALITGSTTASKGQWYAIEIDASELPDADHPDSCFIQLVITSSNAAHYISAWYLLYEPKEAADLTISAIA